MGKTEITVEVFEDLQAITNKLSNLGFKQIEKYELNDWYYSNLSTNSKLGYSQLLKNSFLVRQVISDSEKIYLCYKDKEVDKNGKVLSEEKIKVPLNNLQDTLKIFNKANINCWCSLKQTIYEFQKGSIEFSVQVVDDLGNFIEYEENETMKNLTTEQKMEQMSSQLKSLGLKLGSDFSCKKVYAKYLKNLNIASKDLCI